MRIRPPGTWPEGDELPGIARLGLSPVDDEHAGLYLLAQELMLFPEDPITCRRCTRVMHAIWISAFDHFGEEERLMRAWKLAPEELFRHAEDHMRHLNHVAALWTGHFDAAPPSAGQVAQDLAGLWARHIARYDSVLIAQGPNRRTG